MSKTKLIIACDYKIHPMYDLHATSKNVKLFTLKRIDLISYMNIKPRERTSNRLSKFGVNVCDFTIL